MTRRYFGTDGVRGSYGGPVINESFATRLGLAAARWLQGTEKRIRDAAGAAIDDPAARRVLLGRDTRASGVALEAAVAAGLRAEGAEQANEINAKADRDQTVIIAEAERDAQKLRGEGDAEAARIYGEAASKDPGFYAFQRSLEAYRKAFDGGNDVIVLERNDPFLQYMRSDH